MIDGCWLTTDSERRFIGVQSFGSSFARYLRDR